MAQQRIYASDAERQRAYRDRARRAGYERAERERVAARALLELVRRVPRHQCDDWAEALEFAVLAVQEVTAR